VLAAAALLVWFLQACSGLSLPAAIWVIEFAVPVAPAFVVFGAARPFGDRRARRSTNAPERQMTR